MKNDERLDFIRNVYESEKQDLPDELSKENIVGMLGSVQQGPKPEKIVVIRKIASLAAAFIVIICAVLAGSKAWDKFYTQSITTEEYAEIETHFLGLYSKYKTNAVVAFVDDAVDGAVDFLYDSIGSDKFASADTADPEEGAPESDNMTPTMAVTQSLNSTNGSMHGQTNVQVENVDEADIIKNDGEYIYILTGSGEDNLYSGDVIRIIRGSDLKEVTTLSVERKENTVFNGKEMYVQGDKLVLIGNTAEVIIEEESKSSDDKVVYNGLMETTTAYAPGSTQAHTVYCFAESPEYDTVILTYDISDISKPELISEKKQSGEYKSSRMIDEILYTVSNYWVSFDYDGSEKEVIEVCVPKVNGERIPAEDIEIKLEENTRRYTVITASDTASEDLSGGAYAYLGNSEEIYCSTDTLYFVYSDYDNKTNEDTTVINAISLSKDKISRKATGSVYGYFNNQFSMDEYNGYLRVATTGYNNSTFKDESNLYVLDDKLEIVGKLENMADNEEVKSVRFVGDTAYVVTFEQTDPLFVIDLSKPTEPKVSGFVKLPGYSTYLHPISSDYLVGVGFGGTEESADLSALKVTLFDVSDPENPKVVSNFEVCEAGTEITDSDNHKAFLYYPEKNLIGIPVKKYNYTNGYREVFSYAVLEIKDGELQLKNGYVHQQEGTRLGGMFRGTYIDDTLYTISDSSICAFGLDSGELIKMTEYK